jgi:hypothetical protein
VPLAIRMFLPVSLLNEPSGHLPCLPSPVPSDSVHLRFPCNTISGNNSSRQPSYLYLNQEHRLPSFIKSY